MSTEEIRKERREEEMREAERGGKVMRLGVRGWWKGMQCGTTAFLKKYLGHTKQYEHRVSMCKERSSVGIVKKFENKAMEGYCKKATFGWFLGGKQR